MSIHDLQVLLALSFGSIVDAGSVVKFCSLFCSELRRESTVDRHEERCLHGTALSLLFERLSAKIRRGIEEYEQGKVYRVKEGDC